MARVSKDVNISGADWANELEKYERERDSGSSARLYLNKEGSGSVQVMVGAPKGQAKVLGFHDILGITEKVFGEEPLTYADKRKTALAVERMAERSVVKSKVPLLAFLRNFFQRLRNKIEIGRWITDRQRAHDLGDIFQEKPGKTEEFTASIASLQELLRGSVSERDVVWQKIGEVKEQLAAITDEDWKEVSYGVIVKIECDIAQIADKMKEVFQEWHIEDSEELNGNVRTVIRRTLQSIKTDDNQIERSARQELQLTALQQQANPKVNAKDNPWIAPSRAILEGDYATAYERFRGLMDEEFLALVDAADRRCGPDWGEYVGKYRDEHPGQLRNPDDLILRSGIGEKFNRMCADGWTLRDDLYSVYSALYIDCWIQKLVDEVTLGMEVEGQIQAIANFSHVLLRGGSTKAEAIFTGKHPSIAYIRGRARGEELEKPKDAIFKSQGGGALLLDFVQHTFSSLYGALRWELDRDPGPKYLHEHLKSIAPLIDRNEIGDEAYQLFEDLLGCGEDLKRMDKRILALTEKEAADLVIRAFENEVI